MPNSQEYYDQQTANLRKAIADGEIVTIVGAGASMAATEGHAVSSWLGLLENGIQHCLDNVPGTDNAWAARRRASLQEGDVEEVVSAATLIENKLRSAEGIFHGWLRDTIGSLTVADATLSRVLKALPTRLVTTNGLVEQFLENTRRTGKNGLA